VKVICVKLNMTEVNEIFGMIATQFILLVF
jgi:hypothetical protein